MALLFQGDRDFPAFHSNISDENRKVAKLTRAYQHNSVVIVIVTVAKPVKINALKGVTTKQCWKQGFQLWRFYAQMAVLRPSGA